MAEGACFDSNVLVDEDRVPVRVDHHQVSRACCALIGFGGHLNALRFQLTLQFADVGEFRKRLRIVVPSGIKGEHVFLKHALKQADRGRAVFKDQPVLRSVSTENREAKLLIKGFRSFQVFDSQAD